MTPQETIAQLQQTNADLAAQNRRLLALLENNGWQPAPEGGRSFSQKEEETLWDVKRWLEHIRTKHKGLYPAVFRRATKTFKL